MKRTALLLAILAAFSITTVSRADASPVIGEKAVSISARLSQFFTDFLRTHRLIIVETGEKIIIDDGDDVMLRGDADDYANGRSDDKDIVPDGPGDKRSTELE